MIVVDVPEREGELREGTLLKTRMLNTISTSTTMRGAKFTAELTEPIERNGRVILPVGSIVEGRVTEVRGGRRISGGAALHLETSDVTLPDGTHYIVHAQVVNAGKNEFKVTDEGTLKKKGPSEGDAGGDGRRDRSGRCDWCGDRAVEWERLSGAGIGAGVSTVVWLKQDRQATLPKDVSLVFSLTTPMILTPLHGAVSQLNAGSGSVVGAAQ